MCFLYLGKAASDDTLNLLHGSADEDMRTETTSDIDPKTSKEEQERLEPEGAEFNSSLDLSDYNETSLPPGLIKTLLR